MENQNKRNARRKFIKMAGLVSKGNLSREKFDMIGGFEEELPVAYNDIDLCFKLIEKGYFNVVRNDAVLYHHESVSRGYDDDNLEKMLRLRTE